MHWHTSNQPIRRAADVFNISVLGVSDNNLSEFI